jgi:hypothetical protein
MLAKTLKLAIVGLLVGSTTFGGTIANGQQLPQPSQRYQPTELNQVPPSVHVAPAQARRIPTSTYNFSDQKPISSAAHRGPYLVQQTAYQQSVQTEPKVPEILAGTTDFRQTQPRLRKSAADATAPLKQKLESVSQALNQFTPNVAAEKTFNDFAPQMAQAIKSTTPRIAPEEISSQRAILESQLKAIKERTAAREAELAALAKSAAKKASPLTKGLADDAQPKALKQMPIVEKMPVVSQQAVVQQKPALPPSNVQEESASDFSAAEFMRQINGHPIAEATRAVAQSNQPIGSSSMVMDRQVRPVSNDQIAPQPAAIKTVATNAAIRLGAPALEVETFGPQSIGINKPANYEIVVTNNSASPAERILVGINLPQWVDVQKVNLTTGNKEITDGNDKARIVWTIDRIEPGRTQTATVLAVPMKAEGFDVGVEWTLVPRAGKANVVVTEPRLQMNISGPQDVEFGEVARYLVTVRNPGTGTAENVTVKLPEALGGERSVLGDIKPGAEEVFQVELLARTAGELSLVAAATADGEIETSSERKITVRRAKLDVTIEGPAVRFSGDVGHYLITMSNSGDAAANRLVAAVALPVGAKYISGIESVTPIQDGIRWQVGPLEPGQTRQYKVDCQLNGSGDLQVECGVKQGDLAASAACITRVETVADLVLDVEDPRGPLPTNKNVPYVIKVRNRGSRSAKGIELFIQFSEGLEPNSANGHQHSIAPGEVLFSPIDVIEPGQEVSFEVTAAAHQQGTHIFRAQMTCHDSDSREIAEGTTRFFSHNVESTQASSTANAADATFGKSGDFQR